MGSLKSTVLVLLAVFLTGQVVLAYSDDAHKAMQHQVPVQMASSSVVSTSSSSATHASSVSSSRTSTSSISSSSISSPSSASSISSSSSSSDKALTGTKSIIIFLRYQRAYLLENGQVVKTYNISSGKAITPTPVGQFQIYEKQKLRISSQAVPYRMPNYMAFTPNEAFGLHGLPYLGSIKEESAYWREARSHIGIPVSHGCIRFLPEEAAEIYDWAEVGTKVNIQA